MTIGTFWLCYVCLALGLSTISDNTAAEGENCASTAYKPPKLQSGGVYHLGFKSRIDSSVQPLLIKVPQGYTPNQKWPLLVTLHGLGDGPILAESVKSMVQIGPYGRGSTWYTGIGAEDVFECIDLTKELFSIDENRLYLCGFSMGAFATFDLGLRYPSLWAACLPVCGRCEKPELVENGRWLPFWIHAGQKDTLVSAADCKKAFDEAKNFGFSDWRYSEHSGLGHSFAINWPIAEKWLLTNKRVVYPGQVSFTSYGLNSAKAYWIQITSFKDYGSAARIKAEIDVQTVRITTKNVNGYILTLNNNLIDLSKEVEIWENSNRIFNGFLKGDGRFKWPVSQPKRLSKREGLCGPLWDIYRTTCLVVCPAGGEDTKLNEAAKRCADSFLDPRWMERVNFRIVSDTQLKKEDMLMNNLVMFGNAKVNEMIARFAPELPVRMIENTVIADGIRYSSEHIGYVLIYPNPLNHHKYVVVFAGNTARTIDCFNKIWPTLNSAPKSIDIGVFELSEESDLVQWRLKEVFGSNWDWQR